MEQSTTESALGRKLREVQKPKATDKDIGTFLEIKGRLEKGVFVSDEDRAKAVALAAKIGMIRKV